MKQLPGFSKQLVGKEFEKDLLFKIKPKKIFIDKEQVFQENLELKLKVHSLSEETLKLRTKIMQIENELSRKEDQNHWDKPKGSSIVQNLKNTIKDIKLDIQNKDWEISKLKSNLKCSKVYELEAEIQAYIDECTRLRHHLEEVIKIRQIPSETENLNIQALQFLKKENSSLIQLLNSSKIEIKACKEELENEKKKKKPFIKKIDVNTRIEIQKLKTILDTNTKEFTIKEEKYKKEICFWKNKFELISFKPNHKSEIFFCFKPIAPKIFKIIAKGIPNKFKNIEEFANGAKNLKNNTSLLVYIKDSCGDIKIKHIEESLKFFGLNRTEDLVFAIKEWFEVFNYNEAYEEKVDEKIKEFSINKHSSDIKVFEISNEKVEVPSFSIVSTSFPDKSHGSDTNRVKSSNFEENINPFIVSADILNLIEKLAFTLQIHRIEKADFCRIFENTEKITFKDLQNTFVKDPFKFDLESSEKISKFLFGLTNLSDFVLISEIQAKFEKYSENWKTFSQDDEDMLDSELKEFVSKNSLSFYKKSLEKDEKKQGIIEWKDFLDILS